MGLEQQSSSSSRSSPGRRALPHNVDLEQSILGGIILDNQVLRDLGELETDDFYDFKNRVVFEAIRSLEAKERPIDVVTLEDEIERNGKLDAIGGIAFLGELTLRVPTADNVATYRDSVRLHARNRRAIVAMTSAIERAYTWKHDPSELVAELAGELMRIDGLGTPPAKRIKLLTIGDAMEDLVRMAKVPIFPTPFESINNALGFGGLLGTQNYTVAAATGRGKTSFVAGLAAFAAQTAPVIVASYEMRPGYFVARKAAGVLGVHSNEIIRGNVSVARVLEAMPYARLFLMHKPTLKDLRVAVDYITQKYSAPPLVVVDYIQKLADEIAATQQRPDLRMATSEASATLLDIADRTGAVVVSVSAIGRGKGKLLSQPRKFAPFELVEVAKESGAVEYDNAGLIVLTLSDEMEGDERVGTITLAKVRFGEECHVDARYHGRAGTWRDVGRVDRSAAAELDAAAAAVTPIREAIVRVLDKGPQQSMTSLALATGKNKAAALDEIKRMIAAGLIEKRGSRVSIPAPIEPVSQQLEGLIRAVETEVGQ